MDKSRAIDAVKAYLVGHGGHVVDRFIRVSGGEFEPQPFGVCVQKRVLVPADIVELVLGEAFKPQPAPVDPEMRKWLADCMGAVEASNEEQHQLWADNDRRRDGGKAKEWVSEGIGYGPCVGLFGDKPVHVSLRLAEVAGQWIVFYHATSLVVHHDLVRDWLKAHLPEAAYENRTDAANFHNVFPRS